MNENLELIKNAPVKKAILKLAIPTVLTTIIQLLYNLTDTYFIGLTKDQNMLTAISLAFPVFFLIQAIGNIFAIGAPSYISRMLGQKQISEAKKACSVAFYTSMAVGVVLTVIYIIFMESILKIIGTSPDSIGPTREYLVVIGAFAIVMILQVVLPGLIRAEGATRVSMIGMFIGTITNVILDPLFILGFNMGVGGAAWATIIGNVFAVVYYLIYFMRKKSVLSIQFKDFKPSKLVYSSIFKIGIPASIAQIIMSFSFILYNVLAATYGDFVIAAQGVAGKAFSMVVMISIGFAQGYQPFAGYNYGAGNYHRLIDALKITLLYDTIICIIFTMFFIFLPVQFMGIFTDKPDIISAGVKMMHAMAWCAPLFSVQMTLLVTFQATGQAIKAMFVTLGRQCIIFIPLMFLFNALFRFEGLVYAQPAADIITTMLAICLAVPFLKKLRKLDKSNLKNEFEPDIEPVV